ncbi:GNAT family N-acetyltransferase [Saccharibacillus sp. JS10]|uniref:GNAT family N-acetyltransferase n=1 Tax=Saccharibacillus sp. JS10 TaxID=2950552 RepID=UPI0021092554|nr:GNAT family N-acetyltransferase [Saccharibacillus sp. JS10]MCQ4086448.1 GNAT family N-acetyltransferase [Saccharibacillus sp. JS10]
MEKRKVNLEPMNEEEFRVYRARAVIEFAEDKVKAGTWNEEESLKLSEESYRKYLPDGIHTEGHHLYMIRQPNEQKQIGNIWLHVSEAPAGTVAFLYDIVIEEEYRGKGFGQATMQALDEAARSLGATTIGLHVFGHNETALHVYQKAGYVITDYQMSKKL